MENENQKFMRSVQLMRSFWNVQNNFMRLVQKTASENGLSVPQYAILVTLARLKEATQKNIGERTFLPKSTLSHAVDGLVHAGLLNRKQLEGNRREMLLLLSEKGETMIKTIHLQEGGIHQIFQGAVELLTEKQYQELLVAHQTISTYLEEQGEDTE